MLSHLFGLFSHPKDEWEIIRQEHGSIGKVFFSYILILAAIPPVCGYFGTTMFGWEFGAREAVKLSSESALQIAIMYYLVILVGIFSMGYMIHWMAQTYDADQPLARCVTLAAFIATPMMLIGVFTLLPILWLNFLVGLPALAYTVYLLYTGIPIMMEISEERGFLFSSAVLAVGLVALVFLLAATAVLWGSGFAPQFID